MCMIAAVALFGTTIIASDRRHGLTVPGQLTRYQDHGGKLVRLGSAWLALIGDSVHCQLALEGLAADDASELATISASLSRTASTAAAVRSKRWPGVREPAEKSPYLVTDAGGAAAIAADGAVLLRSSDDLLVVYPNGFPKGDQEAIAAMCTHVRSQWALVRLLARAYAQVAERCASVSPTIELGIGEHYLSGVSARLAVATDDEIKCALRAPPPPDMTAFIRILGEIAA